MCMVELYLIDYVLSNDNNNFISQKKNYYKKMNYKFKIRVSKSFICFKFINFNYWLQSKMVFF